MLRQKNRPDDRLFVPPSTDAPPISSPDADLDTLPAPRIDLELELARWSVPLDLEREGPRPRA